MKNVLILYSAYIPVIDAIKFKLEGNANIFCITDDMPFEDENMSSDLVILLNSKRIYNGNALKIHHSLDNNFDEPEPERQTILSGNKVTGITAYFTKTKKIIFQYPVFIKKETHYDDLVQELSYLEQTTLPIIAEKLLNDEFIESKDVLKSSCGGCSGCCH